MTTSPILNVMIRAARQTGPLAMRHFDRRHQLEVRRKERNEPVSNADTEVEAALLQLLRKAYPQYGVMAEESARALPTKGWYWIVDPIDGTFNFLRGIPHFSFSIALFGEGKVMAGVVYDPVQDELFAAERGRGAFLNDTRLRVNPIQNPAEAFLATGFPSKNKALFPDFDATFQAIYPHCREVRRMGSAALDLAYTAAGRYDGFWEFNLSPWDLAAGALLVLEAGGFVSDFKGGTDFMESGNILAAPPAIHTWMLEAIGNSGARLG